jgi:CHAT domain-containing protein
MLRNLASSVLSAACFFIFFIAALVLADEPAKLSDEQRQVLEAELDKQFKEALEFNSQGKFAEAISAAKKVIELQRQLTGEVEFNGTLWQWIATRYERLDDFGAAKQAYEQALALKTRLFGNDHWQVLDARLSLANVDLLARLPDAARARLREADALLQNVYSLDGQGSFSRAVPLAEQAFAIRKSVLGGEHRDVAHAANWLAREYEYSGDNVRAELSFLTAVEIWKKSLGEAHPDYAVGLSNLALLYKGMGDFPRAEPLARQAAEITKRTLGERHNDYAIRLEVLAMLYEDLGDYARAEPLARQAAEITKTVLGEDHADYAVRLHNLSVLYDHMGNYAKAEPLARQAVEITERTLGKEHPHYAVRLDNLSVIYEHLGDYAKAEPLARESLSITERTLGEWHRDYAIRLNNLSVLYEHLGDYAKAEPLARRALEITKKSLGEDHPDYPIRLHNLAVLYDHTGDYERAQPLYEEALKASRKNLEVAALVQSERQQLATLSAIRFRLDSLVALGMKRPELGGRAFDEVLIWKGLVQGRQRAMRAIADRPELAPLLDELRKTAVRLANLSLTKASSERTQDRNSQIEEASRHKEEIEARLSAASREYRAARKIVKLQDVQTALPEDTALIDFLEYWYSEPKPKEQGTGFKFERRLAAFLVRRNTAVDFFDLGPVDVIREAIDTWRKDDGVSPTAQEAARLLRDKIWTPLANRLSGVSTVLLSPDGELGKLPFAALPGGREGTYLLEDYKLAVISAPQVVVDLAAARKKNPRLAGNLLVLADVDYDSRSAVAENRPKKQFGNSVRAIRDQGDEPFPPLSGTRGELATIQKLYRDNFGADGLTPLEGAAATRDAFVREASKHLYLHLATHGYFASARFLSMLQRNIDNDAVRIAASSPGSRSGSGMPIVAGIGVELNVVNDSIVVMKIVDGGAAALDGRIRSGDKIVGVAQGDAEPVDTKGKSLTEVVGLIRGAPGSRLRLLVQPSGKENIQTYELTRVDISNSIAAAAPPDLLTQQTIGGYHPGLLSGLVLAGANRPDEDDDGILTAEEVTAMNLSDVELVVLSACETGLGQSAGGEGLLGLQRAFQVAGAKTVIASLWKVDDVATRDLMERFYDNLWNKNMGKLEALREAQIWMLKERGPRGLKEFEGDRGQATENRRLPPYFWAAFVLSGDWR